MKYRQGVEMRGVEPTSRIVDLHVATEGPAADLHGGVLRARLEGRREEIEAATLARARGVAEPGPMEGAGYVEGLRATVSAAISSGIAVVELGLAHAGAVPPEVSAQAGEAARQGVCLDTVLRRYFMGYATLCDFIVEEAEACLLPGVRLQRILRDEATLLDHLAAAATSAYTREAEAGQRLSEGSRRLWRVRQILAGGSVEQGELDYRFDSWHLGAVASGPGARTAMRELARDLDRVLLAVSPEDETVWAWLGGRSRGRVRKALCQAMTSLPEGVHLALGDWGQGIGGWRLTHRQARDAHLVALRNGSRAALYRDVALLATALRDEVLAGSLRETYLAPLRDERDGGAALRATLSAYFETGRNASSASARLGVSRQTVNVRLRRAAELLDHPINAPSPELETALLLHDLPSPGGLTVR